MDFLESDTKMNCIIDIFTKSLENNIPKNDCFPKAPSFSP